MHLWTFCMFSFKLIFIYWLEMLSLQPSQNYECQSFWEIRLHSELGRSLKWKGLQSSSCDTMLWIFLNLSRVGRIFYNPWCFMTLNNVEPILDQKSLCSTCVHAHTHTHTYTHTHTNCTSKNRLKDIHLVHTHRWH